MGNTKQQRKQNRKQKKSKRREARLSGFTNTRSILPAMFRGPMYYDTTITIAVAAGALAVNVWRLNSVFDPDLTNVGTSVAGYAALSGLYGRYRVLAAKLHLTYLNQGTVPLEAFAAVNSVNTIGVNYATARAQRHVYSVGLSSSQGVGTKEHRAKVPIHSVYGVPRAQVRNEDDFAAVSGTNPNNVVYLHAGAYSPTASATTVIVTVRIEFDTVWSLPLEFVQ